MHQPSREPLERCILLNAAGQEADVLRLAFAYEQATDWHKRRPNLSWGTCINVALSTS